ncbi:MAG: hypothetical protein ACPL4I_10855 [Bacteroidota bacterium]
MSNVIDLRKIPPHELAEIESSLAADLFWSEKPVKVVGGYAVKPRKIADLKPLEVAGIRARLSYVSSVYLPVTAVYFCPVCSAGTGKRFTYKKHYLLSSAIGETFAKKFGLYTDRCPVCGSTTYLIPGESKFVRQVIATASDDTGMITAVINADVVDVVTADLTGIVIPVGKFNIFYAFGYEPVEEPIGYAKIFKMTSMLPEVVAHILATLVKPDKTTYLTSVIIVSHLGAASSYVKLARLAGAKIVYGGAGKLKASHPLQPIVYIPIKYHDLVKLVAYDGPHNLVVLAPFYLSKHLTIRRDITIELTKDVQLPPTLAQLVARAVHMNAEVHGTPLCRSVRRIINVESCQTHITL